MQPFKAHSKSVYELAFSPDWAYLLSSSGDRTIHLWRLDPLERVQEWPGSPLIAPIAFSPDGRYAGAAGYVIRVWRIGDPGGAVVESAEWAESCAFSPDGTVFAAVGAERALMRWAIPSGSPLPGGWGGTRALHNGSRFPSAGLAFSPDGARIVTCFGVQEPRGFQTVLHFWDAASGALLDTLRIDFDRAHPKRLAFSPDGALLAADTGPTLRVWNTAANAPLAALKLGAKHVKGFAFSHDSRTLFAIDGGSALRSWSTSTWTENEPIDPQIGKLTSIAASCESCVAIGSSAGRIRVLLFSSAVPHMPG